MLSPTGLGAHLFVLLREFQRLRGHVAGHLAQFLQWLTVLKTALELLQIWIVLVLLGHQRTYRLSEVILSL